MKAVERPIEGRTTLEKIINRLNDAIGTAEVVFRAGNNAQGKSMKLVVTTSTGSVLELVLADHRLHWRCESGEGRASWT